MKRWKYLAALVLLLGCASNVRFIQTDESFVPQAKPEDAELR